MNIRTFQTDKSLETEGVWQDVGDGGELLIARLGNKKYQDAVRKRMKPYKQAIKQDRLPDEVADKIVVTALADHILLDWRGIKDGPDGPVVEYTRETAIAWLTDMPDFRELVLALANDMESYRTADIEDDAGN